MKDKTQTITFYAVCVFLLCYFMRIFNMPNELTLTVGALLCLVLVVQQKKLRIDLGICLLTITMVSYYVIINGVKGMAFSILYIPLIIYELGNYVACAIAKDKNQEKKLLLLIFTMIIGFAIHGILNSYMWYAGYAVPGTRRWPDFWSWEIVPGTQHVAYFIPAMAMFAPSILYFNKRKGVNVINVLLTAFFGYTALSTRSRMTLLIFCIVIFLQCCIWVILEWESVKMKLKNKRLYVALGIVFIVIIAGVFLVKDSPVVVAFINNLGKDGGILNNVRFTAQRLAINQIFDYPMGGYQMDLGTLEMTHNTWLDIANAAGIIPFFSFLFYTIYISYKMFRLCNEKNVTTEIKIIVTGLFISFFLYYMVEPALEASIHWITPWIFLNGISEGYSNKKLEVK